MLVLLTFSFCKSITYAGIEFRSLAPFYQDGGFIFWVPAFGPNGHQAGLCTALRQHLHSSILSAGTIMHKRAQFHIIKIGSQKVGLMNIYAPNSALERACLWMSLSEYAGIADCWLVGGARYSFKLLSSVFVCYSFYNRWSLLETRYTCND